jgi:hypothetical protein
MVAGLGAMAQQGLSDECVMMDARRVVALSGINDGRPNKVNELIPFEDGSVEDRGGGLLEHAHILRTEGLLDRFVLPARGWVAWCGLQI